MKAIYFYISPLDIGVMAMLLILMFVKPDLSNKVSQVTLALMALAILVDCFRIFEVDEKELDGK